MWPSDKYFWESILLKKMLLSGIMEIKDAVFDLDLYY